MDYEIPKPLTEMSDKEAEVHFACVHESLARYRQSEEYRNLIATLPKGRWAGPGYDAEFNESVTDEDEWRPALTKSRNAKYSSNAERQKAYRQRKKAIR